MLSRRQILGAMAAAPLPAAPRLPNIVYILADDLGWGDPRCYNPDSKIPTPNIDKLASQGVRFTDMHSPSSVCTPTRYGILTGRYCWRSKLKQGVLVGDSPNLIEPGRPTVASLLKSRGYRTGAVGKWHLGLGSQAKADYGQRLSPNPNDHGFDYFFGIPASLDFEPYVYVENDRAVEPPTSSTPGRNEPRGVFWRGGGMAPSFDFEQCLPTLTSKAVKFIEESASKPSPFFLYFPLTGPHTPWLPLKQWQGKSGAGIYGDFVAQVDDVLGQVTGALEKAGAAKDTLLVFTSDNGAHWTPEDKAKYPHRANANWRGMKADIHDAGHRIPFLARWPGRIKPGAVSNQLGCLTDLMATAGAASGYRVPDGAGEDSFNLLPAYLGKKSKGMREAVVHHSSMGMFSIRRGNWKLNLGRGSGGFSSPQKVVVKPGEPAGELFDLAADPSESADLYSKRPEKVAELTALLDRYKAEGRSRPA